MRPLWWTARTFALLLSGVGAVGCQSPPSEPVDAIFESLRGRESEYHEAFARPAIERYRCMDAHVEEGHPGCNECAQFFQAGPCFPPYYRGTLLEVRGRWILVEFEPPGVEGYMHPSMFMGGEDGMRVHARGVAHSGTRWIALAATESTESLSPGLEVTSFGEAPGDSIYWMDPNGWTR